MDAGAEGDALVPYLKALRGYMPAAHARLLADLEEIGPVVRSFAKRSDA